MTAPEAAALESAHTVAGGGGGTVAPSAEKKLGASSSVLGAAERDTVPCLPPREPELRVMPMPADLNPAGDVFGGWVMAMVDIAGSLPARRRARGRVATVAVNSFVFKQPIAVGDVVSFYATIVAEGRTSVTVDVEVYAERHPESPVFVKVTEARLTYVALDERGQKRPLPPK